MCSSYSFRIVSSLAVATLSSCAAMFTGTSSDVGFQTDPPGALLRIGEEEFTTPCTVDLDKSTKMITLDHPNYDPVEIEIDRSFQGGFLVLDILFTPGYGLVGILVDSLTSAFYSLPPIIHYDFDRREVIEGGSLPGYGG